MDQAIIDLLNNSVGHENIIEHRTKTRRGKTLQTLNDSVGVDKSGLVDDSGDVYIKDGEPTDAFLEAIRRDLDGDFFRSEESCQSLNGERDESPSSNNAPRLKSRVINKPDGTSKKYRENCTNQGAYKQMKRRKSSVQENANVSSKLNKKCMKGLQQGQADLNAIDESKSGRNPADKIHSDSQHGDQDAIIKSLHLRLVGAIGTIKELQNNAKSLEFQNKELSCANIRLQSKLKATEKTSQTRIDLKEESHIDFLTKEIDDLKKQLHHSEMRTDEEISERLKWEERCRNWKHSAEQLKQKLRALEISVNTKLENESAKLGKSSRRIVSKLEAEIASLKSQLVDAQNKLRCEESVSSDLLLRLEKSNELIQDLKEEKRLLLERVEERDIQLGVVTQRNRVRNIADKLNCVPPPPNSNLESARNEFLEQKSSSLSKAYLDSSCITPNKRSVPVKFLLQPAMSTTCTSFPPNTFNANGDRDILLKVEGNSVPAEQNLHSDTVALIKSIAAKTITSLPQRERSDNENDRSVCLTTETQLDNLYKKIRGAK